MNKAKRLSDFPPGQHHQHATIRQTYLSKQQKTQICNEDYPWCVDGSCNKLSSSPWHDVGMPASHLELFVSWVPLIGGSLGAMIGGILSDRIAKVSSRARSRWPTQSFVEQTQGVK